MTELDSLLQELAGLRAELVETRSQARLAQRSWRFTIGVVAAAILLGGILLWKVNDTSHQRSDDVTAFFHALCDAQNDARAGVRDYSEGHTAALFRAFDVDPANPPAESAARVRAFQSEVDQLERELAPLNCESFVEQAGAAAGSGEEASP